MIDSYIPEIEKLKDEVHQNDKIARELSEEGFRLQIEWIDKIITLSLSIISLTITILLALKDSNSQYSTLSVLYFWMWLILAISALLCLFARFSYSRLKLAQSSNRISLRNGAISHHNTLVTLQKMYPPFDNNILEIGDKIDDLGIPSGGRTKVWHNIAHYSSLGGFIFFISGIILFVYIGNILVK